MPLLLAIGAAWAAFALAAALGDDDQTASDAPDQASETTGVSLRLPRATTTTIVPVVPGAPTLGEPTGLHLLAEAPGTLLDIDLDTGGIAEHDIGGRVVGGDGRGVLLLSAGVLTWRPFPLESGEVRIVTDNASGAWLLEGVDALWVDRGGGRVDLFGLDGTFVARMDLPGGVAPVAVAGDQLVVVGAGRVYTVGPDSAVTDLGPATLLAAGHGRLLLYRCDGELRCEEAVVELDGAGPVAVPTPWPTPDALVDSIWVGPTGSALYALRGQGGVGLSVGAGDALTRLFSPGDALFTAIANVSFSADGRWLAAVGNGRVWLGAADASHGVTLDLGRGAADGSILLVPTGG